MLVGLDMGGTHTDAVVIRDAKVWRYTKVLTSPHNFLESIQSALKEVLAGIPLDNIRRVNLSTTVSTNAIVEGKTAPVGLVLEPGPGLNPAFLACGRHNYFLSSAIDHRGRETAPLKEEELREAASAFRQRKIGHLAIVGKFSPRNPAHELAAAEYFKKDFPHLTLGHRLSGRLNFPRRVFSAYFNAAVADTYRSFAQAMMSFCSGNKITAPIYILKADGGTLSLETSREMPIETILSGPAASIMGALALAPTNDDAIILDIGGTTTDIAFLAGGAPLLEPQGAFIAGRPTLVRALLTRSLGLGGDSYTRVEGGGLRLGPQRHGPAMALGGPQPTPTDALLTLERINIGDPEAARRAMKLLGLQLGLGVEDVAEQILRQFACQIAVAVESFLKEINSRPVYTVREVLEDKKINPTHAIAIGAPANALAPYLEETLKLPVKVPELAEIANAVGAALSRVTAEISLQADTEQKVLLVPELGLKETIPASFNLATARGRALNLIRERARQMGAYPEQLEEVEITEEQSFNMVRGFWTSGRNIRLKAQIKPGLETIIRR
ncbi:MAG: hypothetical protein PWP65_211 [Clostridia bacterium]|nr:hypothetical protein [Clostridia bacterium]